MCYIKVMCVLSDACDLIGVAKASYYDPASRARTSVRCAWSRSNLGYVIDDIIAPCYWCTRCCVRDDRIVYNITDRYRDLRRRSRVISHALGETCLWEFVWTCGSVSWEFHGSFLPFVNLCFLERRMNAVAVIQMKMTAFLRFYVIIRYVHRGASLTRLLV